MNVNFGLLPSLGKKIRNKKEKNALIAEALIECFAGCTANNQVSCDELERQT